MKLFKSFVLAGLMAVVAYGVYATIVKGPKTQTAATAPAPLWQDQVPPGPVEIVPGELLPAPDVTIPGGNSAPPEMAAVPPSHDPSHTHGPDGHAPAVPTPGATTAEVTQPGAGGTATAVSPVPPAEQTYPINTVADTQTIPGAMGASQAVDTSTAAPAAPATPSQGQSPDIQSAFDAALLQVNQLAAENRLAEAHLHLSRWYASRDQLDPQRAQTLLDLLDRLAAKVVYSRESHLDRPHVVQPNETLESIANQYGVPARLLEKINGIQDPAALRPGMELKVVRGPFHAEVQLSRFEMTLFLNDGRYAGRFPIGIGNEVPAKEGEYVVTDKAYDPPYTSFVNGQVYEIPGGNPNNPLGSRLVELGVQAGQQGELAIHGTNNPQTIGTTAPEGCIRLKPQDADDVYDILTTNTSKVIIRR